MDSIIILCDSFYDCENRSIKIGGVETYIYDLAKCLNRIKKTIVYQISENNLNMVLDGIQICTVNIKKTLFKSQVQLLFRQIYSKKSLFIIATDQLNIKASYKNVIQIQHGIAFDIPGNMLPGVWRRCNLLQIINKLARCLKNVNRFYNVPNVVCVDYNYYNWFRTIGTIRKNGKFRVIPNYSSTAISNEELYDKLGRRKRGNIIFARRFVDYRGTLLFIAVVKRLLVEYEDIKITFAGSGPLVNIVQEAFVDEKRVTITSFRSSESIQFHRSFDIAVVPTIFSEGTSLALCEAMAAGCYPIATHVGGMTNMILDRYNGRLVYPSEFEVYTALVETLNLDYDQFAKSVVNSYNVAIETFSKARWEKDWINFVTELLD